MNRVGLTLGLAGLGLGIGGFVLHARRGRLPIATAPGGVIALITPVIDLRIAENVLAMMERMSTENVTLVIHTQGGCVASCVMIAKALSHFEQSTAIVPYMAISGGTLIALSATTLAMGRNAALSAVDPIVLGQRAKNMDESEDPVIFAQAREYQRAISGLLRETLKRRLPDSTEEQISRAHSVFMGEANPHEWPISSAEVGHLGIPVELADPRWAPLVDNERKGWW